MATDRISISHRIYMGFGFLILALLGLGVFATYQFDEMAGSTEVIGEKITLVGDANEYSLQLQELADALLMYAQSAKLENRQAVEQQLTETKSVEEHFVTLLEDKGLSEQAASILMMSKNYTDTLGPLLLRIENTGASADMVLFGANKLVLSAPALAEKLVQIASIKPEYAVLSDKAQRIIVASNKALLETLTYVIKPGNETLQNARNAASTVDEVLAETKANMKGLPRRDKKALKFLGRDNDLLKQGYVQFQGSNLGLTQSFHAFRKSIEQTMTYATNIRQTAIDQQNQTTQAVADASTSTITSYVVTMVVVALIAILLGAVTSQSILRPLRRVTHDMMRLGDGDTNIELADKERRDEVGSMAKAVVVFRQNALDVERLTEQRLEDQKREEEKRSASLMAMADTVESETGVVVEQVASQTKELSTAVGTMAGSAERVSSQANDVAQAAESSLDLAQRVAEAARGLAGSIDTVAEKVERQRAIANTAQAKAQTSSQSVETLSAAADNIGGVIALINNIAHQTNLLALNATIEAERAGSAGKGFAVVASEVKQLAKQTSQATAQIAKQIEGVRSVTKTCVSSIEEVNHIIGDMSAISAEVSQSVTEQIGATREITDNMQNSFEVSEHLNNQITSASEEMQGVRSLSDELGIVSRRVTSMVESLQMSLNTAVRSASDAMNDNGQERRVLITEEIQVILKGQRGTYRSTLLDISNNGMALNPSIDVQKGDVFTASVEGIKGTFDVEILSKRGTESPKTRIRFSGELEERPQIVSYVANLWRDRLRDDILGGNSEFMNAAE